MNKIVVFIIFLSLILLNIYAKDETSNKKKVRNGFKIVKDIENLEFYKSKVKNIVNDIEKFDNYLISLSKKKKYNIIDFLMIEELAKEFNIELNKEIISIKESKKQIENFKLDIEIFITTLKEIRKEIVKRNSRKYQLNISSDIRIPLIGDNQQSQYYHIIDFKNQIKINDFVNFNYDLSGFQTYSATNSITNFQAKKMYTEIDLKKRGSFKIGRFDYIFGKALIIGNIVSGFSYKREINRVDLIFKKFKTGMDFEILGFTTGSATDNFNNFFLKFTPFNSYNLLDLDLFIAYRNNNINSFKGLNKSSWYGLSSRVQFEKGDRAEDIYYYLDLAVSSNTKTATYEKGGIAAAFGIHFKIDKKRDIDFGYLTHRKDYDAMYIYDKYEYIDDFYDATRRYSKLEAFGKENSMYVVDFKQKYRRDNKNLLQIYYDTQTKGAKASYLKIKTTNYLYNKIKYFISYERFKSDHNVITPFNVQNTTFETFMGFGVKARY